MGWNGLNRSGSVKGSYEHGNEPTGFIKFSEVLE
jgi:hypothetical protein